MYRRMYIMYVTSLSTFSRRCGMMMLSTTVYIHQTCFQQVLDISQVSLFEFERMQDNCLRVHIRCPYVREQMVVLRLVVDVIAKTQLNGPHSSRYQVSIPMTQLHSFSLETGQVCVYVCNLASRGQELADMSLLCRDRCSGSPPSKALV